MSVKSVQAHCTAYATRIKFIRVKLQNTTAETGESYFCFNSIKELKVQLALSKQKLSLSMKVTDKV